MNVTQYKFVLTGVTPLLMHQDSIDWSDAMEAWKNDPANAKKSRAGDDRTPAFRWIGCLYLSGVHVCMPSDVLMAALRKGASRVLVPGGRSGKTFKEDSMSGMSVDDPFCAFLVNGKQVPQTEVEAMKSVSDYAEHQKFATKHGFSLFAKRAKIGASKHIRVRPRFDDWKIVGTISVWDERLDKALPDIFQQTQNVGLCDWRPTAPKSPGPFGKFKAEVKSV